MRPLHGISINMANFLFNINNLWILRIRFVQAQNNFFGGILKGVATEESISHYYQIKILATVKNTVQRLILIKTKKCLIYSKRKT